MSDGGPNHSSHIQLTHTWCFMQNFNCISTCKGDDSDCDSAFLRVIIIRMRIPAALLWLHHNTYQVCLRVSHAGALRGEGRNVAGILRKPA